MLAVAFGLGVTAGPALVLQTTVTQADQNAAESVIYVTGYEFSLNSQRFSPRLATLRARAKASALRILCCWLTRASIRAQVVRPVGDVGG
jgi:hypothetical protein